MAGNLSLGVVGGFMFSTGMNLCRILIYHDFRFWICLIDRVSVSAPTLTQIESQVRPLRNPLRWCTLSLRLESTQGLPLNLLSSRPYIYSSAGYQQELSDCSINRQQFVFQVKQFSWIGKGILTNTRGSEPILFLFHESLSPEPR